MHDYLIFLYWTNLRVIKAMKTQSLIQQFRQMVADIENNSAIDVVTCRFNAPATKEELDAAQSKFNLTPAMVDFYRDANGIEIQWERQG